MQSSSQLRTVRDQGEFRRLDVPIRKTQRGPLVGVPGAGTCPRRVPGLSVHLLADSGYAWHMYGGLPYQEIT
jgi:hypothetical protein